MVERISQNQIQQVEQTRVRETEFNKQFDECLNQALDESQNRKPVQAEIRPLAVTNLQEVLLRKTPEDLAPVEKTLDLMDRLTAALGDPQASSESFAPLIRNLGRYAQGLMAGAGRLPEGDKARSLMEQTAVTAMVQVSKFNRGDFL